MIKKYYSWLLFFLTIWSCNSESTEIISFECVNGVCESVNEGRYSTIIDCENNCSVITSVSYDCLNGYCDTVAGGKYNTILDCQDSCKSSSNCEGTRITDPRDGNTYKIIQIGDQCWFAENLRYSGDVFQVQDEKEWSDMWWDSWNSSRGANGIPAWCYYDNNMENDSIFGKLYNWYAVESGLLCPSGWHIPSQSEWKTLINHLGGDTIAGGKMKSTSIWFSPNTGATNESGFTAYPGGARFRSGEFKFKGGDGQWWSSSNHFSHSAFIVSLSYYFDNATPSAEYKGVGLSCRCVKDPS